MRRTLGTRILTRALFDISAAEELSPPPPPPGGIIFKGRYTFDIKCFPPMNNILVLPPPLNLILNAQLVNYIDN
jgi:hypothetical protein